MRLMAFSRSGRTLLASLAAGVAIGLTASPALAVGTWTIKPGGAITFGLVRATVKDSKTGSVIECPGGRLTGMLKSGSGLDGTRAGSIAGGAIKGCPGPGPLNWTITLLGLPWHVNLISYDGSAGLVYGTISHLEIGAMGSGCRFVIDGTRGGASDGIVRFTYSEHAHQVKTSGGNLHIFNVATGCAGLVANGDPASLTASFTLTPAQSITSP
jgi:hypothetical protein